MNNEYISGKLNNYFNDLLHKYPESPPTTKYIYDFLNRNMSFIVVVILTAVYFTYKYYYKDFEYRYSDNKNDEIKKKKKLQRINNNNKQRIKLENEKIRREKEQLLSIIDELNESIENSTRMELQKPPVIIKEHMPHNQILHNQYNGSNQFSSISNNTDNIGGYTIVPPYSQ